MLRDLLSRELLADGGGVRSSPLSSAFSRCKRSISARSCASASSLSHNRVAATLLRVAGGAPRNRGDESSEATRTLPAESQGDIARRKGGKGAS